MESTAENRAANRRPGGRTAAITERINSAVLDLLVEGGTHACTFKNVAKRANVERSTLYRRYSDRWEMIIDAFMAKGGADVVPDLQGSFAGDLKSVLTKLAANLESPLGPALMAAAAELRAGSSGDNSRAYFDRRMKQLDPMFEAAINRGELPPDLDREALFTFAAGAVYFRLFIAARRLDERFIDSVVESVCSLFCTATPRPERRPNLDSARRS